MKRKSPYRHPVKGHTRDGIKVGHYKRGKGSRPRQTSKKGARGQGDFTVLFYFGQGRESHPIKANTFSNALNAGLGRLQTPEIPDRITIRRT